MASLQYGNAISRFQNISNKNKRAGFPAFLLYLLLVIFMWGVAIFSKVISFGKFAQKTVWSAESENTSANYILPNWVTF